MLGSQHDYRYTDMLFVGENGEPLRTANKPKEILHFFSFGLHIFLGASIPTLGASSWPRENNIRVKEQLINKKRKDKTSRANALK